MLLLMYRVGVKQGIIEVICHWTDSLLSILLIIFTVIAWPSAARPYSYTLQNEQLPNLLRN